LKRPLDPNFTPVLLFLASQFVLHKLLELLLVKLKRCGRISMTDGLITLNKTLMKDGLVTSKECWKMSHRVRAISTA
jgi:hypothetical protein